MTMRCIPSHRSFRLSLVNLKGWKQLWPAPRQPDGFEVESVSKRIRTNEGQPVRRGAESRGVCQLFVNNRLYGSRGRSISSARTSSTITNGR